MWTLERVIFAPPSTVTAAHRRPLLRLLAWMPPALLLTYFALSPQPEFARDPFGDTVRHHLVVALAVLFWLVSLLMQRRLPRPTPLDFSLLAVAAAQVAAMVAAPDRRLGLDPTLNLLAAIILFYVLVDSGGLSAAALQQGIMVMALVAAVFALRSVWLQWQSWLHLVQAVEGSVAGSLAPPTVPRVANVGSHPNILAALLTISVPSFLLALVQWRGLRRVLVVAALAVVELAIFFTLARSAWAGQVAALVVCGLGFSLLSGRMRLPRGVLGAACGLLVAAIAGLAVVLVSGERPIWLFRPSLAPRADMRAVGMRIFLQHPIFGAGPGSYPLLYPSEHGNYPDSAIHSHNIVVQLAADTGTAGLLAGLLLSISVIYLLWRLWRRGDRGLRETLVATAAALVAFFVNGMGDSLHLFPEVLLLLAAVMAIAIRAARERHGYELITDAWWPGYPAKEWAGVVLTAVLLGVAVPLGALWIRLDQAQAHYARSIDLAAKNQWKASAREAEQAIRIDPAMALYHVQAGVVLEQAWLAGSLSNGRKQAIAELRRSLALEPRSAVTDLDLASLLAAEGKKRDALALLPNLRRYANHDSLMLLGAAVIVEQLQPSQAAQAYANLLIQNPTLAASPFWQETVFRRSHFSQIVTLAIKDAGRVSPGVASVQRAIGFYAGLPSALATLPNGGDFASRVARGSLLTSRGDYAKAGALLSAAVRERPDDPTARLAYGDLEAAEGNVDAARHQWVAGAYLGDGTSAFRLGNSFAPGAVPGPVLRAANGALQSMSLSRFYLSYQHYRFAYQRHEPLPIVLQGDWLNALPPEYQRMQTSIQRWQDLAGTSTQAR